MTIELKHVELRKAEVRTRMPFRYGIATLTEVPYLLVFADFEVNRQPVTGVAADVLPPKWFTKQPDATLDDEIAEMLQVIRAAIRNGLTIPTQSTVFDWWRELQQRQQTDHALEGLPPLLTGFGTSLLERTAIDAYCRFHQQPVAKAIHENSLGIQLDLIHPELKSLQPSALLPTPVSSICIRHTVGLADPLTNADILDEDLLDDGLPQSLEACVETYGLKLLKIKLPPDAPAANDRLQQIYKIIQRHENASQPIRFTLDANEAFTSADALQVFWGELCAQPEIEDILQSRLIVLEQPLHRSVALSPATAEGLSRWLAASRSGKGTGAAPKIIIDESDGELHSLRHALDAGYSGTSHKNCKGVFKGIANVCYLRWLQQQAPDAGRYAWTGEDLMNLGPVALQQDLALMAILGLEHAERNGHHYVAGLRHLPASVQRSVLAQHSDLYRNFQPPGEVAAFPAVKIEEGAVSLQSVLDSPFGYNCELPIDDFERVD